MKPKPAPAQVGELRMEAAEFDKIMRHALQAPPPAPAKKRAKPAPRPKKRKSK